MQQTASQDQNVVTYPFLKLVSGNNHSNVYTYDGNVNTFINYFPSLIQKSTPIFVNISSSIYEGSTFFVNNSIEFNNATALIENLEISDDALIDDLLHHDLDFINPPKKKFLICARINSIRKAEHRLVVDDISL